jgi:hypothetical protein
MHKGTQRKNNLSDCDFFYTPDYQEPTVDGDGVNG